jgi:molecular chaperone GrpE
MDDEQDKDITAEQDDHGDNDLTTQLTEANAEAEKNLAGWMRAQADFQNYQRRKEEENKDLIDFAREVAVAKLLPTLDSMDQAIRHAPAVENDDYNKWKDGLTGVLQQLDKALAELGVKKIEAVGKKFDPNFHEAVREIDSDSEPGTVVEEYQVGYELNGKVIRASQVAISK